MIHLKLKVSAFYKDAMAVLVGGDVNQAKAKLDNLPYLKTTKGSATYQWIYEDYSYPKYGISLFRYAKEGRSVATYKLPNSKEPILQERLSELDRILRSCGFDVSDQEIL